MSVGTLPTDEIIEGYGKIFTSVYGQEPRINFLGNQWYQVNGEPVHRTVMLREIERLHDLWTHMRETQEIEQTQQAMRPPSPRRNAVQKLIGKLRRM